MTTMRSQKPECSKRFLANLLLVSTGKVTIYAYVDAVFVSLSLRVQKQMCGGYLTIRERKDNVKFLKSK